MSKPTIGVLTANSQSGLGAVDWLLRRSDAAVARKIRAIVRSADKIPDLKSKLGLAAGDDPRIEFVAGADAKDKASVVTALKGCHWAYLITPTTEDRGALTCKMIEAAKEAEVKIVGVMTSWTVECKTEISHKDFGASEDLARKLFPNNCVFVRGGYFMSNLLSMGSAIKFKNSIFMPFPPESTIVPVDPYTNGSLGAAALISAPAKFDSIDRVVNSSGPETVTWTEVAKLFSELLGKEVNFVQIPTEAAVKAISEHGSAWEADFVAMLIPFAIKGMVRYSSDGEVLTGERRTLKDYLIANKAAFL